MKKNNNMLHNSFRKHPRPVTFPICPAIMGMAMPMRGIPQQMIW